MDKTELYKYLFLKEKDIPDHIMKILWEDGMGLVFDLHPDLQNEFNELLAIRHSEIYPNEGLELIKNLFANFNSELNKIKQDISVKRKREKLNGIKKAFESMLNPSWANEVLDLEIQKHRPYLNDYINIIDKELDSINDDNRIPTK